MRKRLHGWHVTLGRMVGCVLMVWALSGIAMTGEPLVCPLLDPPPPSLEAPTLDATTLARAPAEVLPPGSKATSIIARSWNGRGWYEATLSDGTLQAWDARSGAAVSPFLSPEDVQQALAPHAAPPELLTDFDDHYRKGPLPVYRTPLTVPGGWVVYVDARSGAVEKKTSAWSRAFRWAGLGIHTWNLQSLRKDWDAPRRILLIVLIAVPIVVMGGLSYWLMWLRDRAQQRARTTASPPAIQLAAVEEAAVGDGRSAARARRRG